MLLLAFGRVALATRMASEHAVGSSAFLSLHSAPNHEVHSPLNASAPRTERDNVGAASMMDLVDVDANLLHEALRADAPAHIEAAAAVGVRHFVVPGSTLEDSVGAIALAEKYPAVVFPTVGVHPYNVLACGPIDDAMAQIRQLASSSLVRCVGETGLDVSEGFPALEEQMPWFERQVALACELGKPLFLHERRAHEPFVEVLKRYKSSGSLPPCLVHSFTGTAEEAQEYLRLGFFLGVAGFLCKPQHGQSLRETVASLPPNRLMVETDAPYLGFPGCRQGHAKPKSQFPNVPSALPAVVTTLAGCMDRTPAEVAAATTANARAFFRIAADGVERRGDRAP